MHMSVRLSALSSVSSIYYESSLLSSVTYLLLIVVSTFISFVMMQDKQMQKEEICHFFRYVFIKTQQKGT